MSQSLNRYANPKVVQHLASQYVLGTLSPRARQRLERLLTDHPVLSSALEESIADWQQKFVELDHQTAVLAPKASTWQNIQKILDGTSNQSRVEPTPVSASPSHWLNALWHRIQSQTLHRLMHVFSIAIIAVLLLFLNQTDAPFESNNNLSYVAILAADNETPILVASTYGQSRTLVLNRLIESIKEPNSDTDLELWVVSKTDHQARSLGTVSQQQETMQRQLTEAEWRLIKDSHSLLLTREELGGSAIGEPSDEIVAQGLCIRLKEWRNEV